MSADLPVQEFHDRAAKFIRESFPPCAIEVTEQNSFRLKARITIRLAMFIDVLFREDKENQHRRNSRGEKSIRR